jgi:phosphatidylinositol 4-phosphatase
MIKHLLDTPYLYFSYSYDITHSLQRLNSMPPEFLQTGLLERADVRFVWNGFLLKTFQKPNLKQYCLPLILGCILFITTTLS